MPPLNRLTWEECERTFPLFIEKILTFAEALKLDVSGLVMDHIALRLKNKEDVDALRTEIEEICTNHCPTSSAIINGREILIYTLVTPLIYKNREVYFIELPYPKANHDYPHDGWEHTEFVLPSQAVTLEEFEKVFSKRFPHIKKYRTDMPAGPADQRPNPSIILEKEKGLSIKFHPLSIEEVITSS